MIRLLENNVLQRVKSAVHRIQAFEAGIIGLANLNPDFEKHPIFTVIDREDEKRLLWKQRKTNKLAYKEAQAEFRIVPEALGLDSKELSVGQKFSIDMASFRKPKDETSGTGYELLKRCGLVRDMMIYATGDWTASGKGAIKISSIGLELPPIPKSGPELFTRVEKEAKKPTCPLITEVYQSYDNEDKNVVRIGEGVFSRNQVDGISKVFPGGEWRTAGIDKHVHAALFQEDEMKAVIMPIDLDEQDRIGTFPYKQPGVKKVKRQRTKRTLPGLEKE